MNFISNLDLDYFELIKLGKKSRKEESHPIQVALLCDAATQQLALVVEGLFAKMGLKCKVYEPHFDAIESEISDKDSPVYKSDIIFIFYSSLAFRDKYYTNVDRIEDFILRKLDQVESNLKNLRQSYKGPIIQSNLSQIIDRQYGGLDHQIKLSLISAINQINQRIYAVVNELDSVFLNNIEYEASIAGLKKFYDERLWVQAKTPASLEYIPAIAKGIYKIFRATKGSIIKCLILDLDNTLWGGVIGDDGIEGIELGHFGSGEAFLHFQSYLKFLKNHGIILAVCSKNTKEVALTAFRDHPDMVLKEDDIACFVANWNNKADNIVHIQEVLNIGFDSMVFIDDNPFERNLVRNYIQNIHVPEMPEEPSEYVNFLSQLNLLENTVVTAEDSNRVQMYREQSKRKDFELQTDNKEDYLKSLKMGAQISRFDAFNLPRIAQLIQRSNQFNLMTSRFNQKECEDFQNDQTAAPLYIKLADQFGDYGLISVIISQSNNETLYIKEWIMSCRVLKRGVENLAMNYLFSEAKTRGLKFIEGQYLPTPKNKLVENFYKDFGFESLPDGKWRMSVEKYQQREHFIEIKEQL